MYLYIICYINILYITYNIVISFNLCNIISYFILYYKSYT